MLVLGAHDDFTLYAVVGLKNSGAGDRELFELARRVHGWGRIEVVERLADTNDPEIQEWMVLEGYRNSVMYEYLALLCAKAGNLAGRLADERIDAELLNSAGDILVATATGNPGPPVSEYPDLATAISRYLAHVVRRDGTLKERQTVASLRALVADSDELVITPDERSRLLTVADEFLARGHYRALIGPALRSDDSQIYWTAKQAARDLDVDIYDALVERIESSLDDQPVWFDLLEATTSDRIERSLALGRRHIDVRTIATGPSAAIGMGPGFGTHMQVGWFLQALADYPGMGWDFVSAGLASSSIQNRNRALRTLRSWPRESWPDDAADVVSAAIRAEVDDEVRTLAEDVLRGDVPLHEAWRRTIEGLQDRGAELVPLARRLAESDAGKLLRSESGFGALLLWNGPYDSAAHEQLHLTVGYDLNGFNVTLSQRIGDETERRTGLTAPDAEALALQLAQQLR